MHLWHSTYSINSKLNSKTLSAQFLYLPSQPIILQQRNFSNYIANKKLGVIIQKSNSLHTLAFSIHSYPYFLSWATNIEVWTNINNNNKNNFLHTILCLVWEAFFSKKSQHRLLLVSSRQHKFCCDEKNSWKLLWKLFFSSQQNNLRSNVVYFDQ